MNTNQADKILEIIKSLLCYKLPEIAINIVGDLKYKIDNNFIYHGYINKNKNVEIGINLEAIKKSYADVFDKPLKENYENDKNFIFFGEFVMLHEICHFVLRHFTREDLFESHIRKQNRNFNKSLYDLCREIECNNVTEKLYNLTSKRKTNDAINLQKKLNLMCIHNMPDYIKNLLGNIDNMTAEEMYEILDNDQDLKNKKIEGCEDIQSIINNNKITGYIILEKIINEKNDEISKSEKDKLKTQEELFDLNDVIKMIGDESAGLLIKIKKKVKKVYVPDFKSLAYTINSKNSNPRKTYSRTSHLSTGFLNIFEHRIRDLKQITPVGIVCDTSGSVSQRQLESVYSLLENLIDKCGIVYLVSVDTAVSEVAKFTSKKDINLNDHLEFKGGGGTRLQPGIDKLEEYKDIKQIIVLTDGYIDNDDLVRRKKPLMVMLYDVSNSTDEIIKNKHEYYYLTNE